MYQLANRLPFFYGWSILFATGSSMVVRNAAASLTLAVFIFPMSDDLGWSRALIAGAASFGGLVAMVASPVTGWALDRYGARVILTSSVIVLGLTTMSLAWATAPIAFYLAYGAGRVIFASPLNIGCSVVVSRWFVKKRGTCHRYPVHVPFVGYDYFSSPGRTGNKISRMGRCVDSDGLIGLCSCFGAGIHAGAARPGIYGVET